jgi:uncharacterized protein
MLNKILLVLLLVIGVMLLLRHLGRPRVGPRRDAGPNVEAMVRCVVCGIHVPRSEGLMQAGRTFCSDEHRRQYGA